MASHHFHEQCKHCERWQLVDFGDYRRSTTEWRSVFHLATPTDWLEMLYTVILAPHRAGHRCVWRCRRCSEICETRNYPDLDRAEITTGHQVPFDSLPQQQPTTPQPPEPDCGRPIYAGGDDDDDDDDDYDDHDLASGTACILRRRSPSPTRHRVRDSKRD